MGLNEWARKFVEGEEIHLFTDVVHRTFPGGETVVVGPTDIKGRNVTVLPHDTLEGAFGNDFPLWHYKFDDGREYFEYVQAEPWSSGPCFFIALRDSKGDPVPESLWPQSEIEDA